MAQVASGRPLRVGIVGVGIGTEHLIGLLNYPETYEVRYLCDRDVDRARRAAENAAVPQVRSCELMQELLDDPEIDIVDICLPPHLHAEATLRCLAAGKHVICEKPLVFSLKDVDDIEAARDASGCEVFPVFQYRFRPGAHTTRTLIDAGLAGKLFVAAAETHWQRDADYYEVPWRGRWETEGGGAIMGQAIHVHDLISYLAGPVVSVQARLATRVNDIEVDDCGGIVFGLASGAIATSSITLGASGNTSRLRLCFENMTVESGAEPEFSSSPWHFKARGSMSADELAAARDAAGRRPNGFPSLFMEIAQALRGEPSLAVTLADGRTSVEMATAIYASARTGQTVDLPIAQDHPLYGGWAPAP